MFVIVFKRQVKLILPSCRYLSVEEASVRWVDVVEGATLEPQISRRNKMWSTRWKHGVYALLVYERFQSFFILSGAEASVDAQLAFHLRRDSSASCVRCRLCSSPCVRLFITMTSPSASVWKLQHSALWFDDGQSWSQWGCEMVYMNVFSH